MKKIVLMTMLFILTYISVSAEEQQEFAMMRSELPENIFSIEPSEQQEMSFFSSVDLGNEKSGAFWEEKLYNQLDEIFSPDNIVNQSVGKYSNSNLYYIYMPYIDFKIDNSLGTIEEQAWIRAAQIHGVYARYLQNNPEYFYLMPRQYGMSYKQVSSNTVRIWFAATVAYDIPEFDGSKTALARLRTQYYELMNEIEKIKEEIYFEGMTDLDKLLLAHDYITENTAYYLTYDENGNSNYGDGYSYNSYGILVKKQGVCQGLSYAYPCILKALGFPVENVCQIRSNELMHMWNLVKLDGKWYHVDLTWDDPLYAYSGKRYDMNDSSLQYEYHDYFLISDSTNTKKRNEKGYYNFITEVLGYDEINGSLADDETYESGWFFNDPVNNSLTEIPGRVEYEDGYYKRYYKNEDVYFTGENLKASDYLISQITYNQYDVPLVWILGSGKRTRPYEVLTQYISYYKDGRFEKALAVNQNVTGFGMHPLYDYKAPEEGEIVKIITTDTNFIPVGNVSVME